MNHNKTKPFMILFTGLNIILNFRGLFITFRLTYLRNECGVRCIQIFSYQIPCRGVSVDFMTFCLTLCHYLHTFYFRHCANTDILSDLYIVYIITIHCLCKLSGLYLTYSIKWVDHSER